MTLRCKARGFLRDDLRRVRADYFANPSLEPTSKSLLRKLSAAAQLQR